MNKAIEFFFDFGSPYSYLANTQLPSMAKRAGVEIVYCPVDVLSLLKLAGNRPTTLECKNKRRHAPLDFSRWAALYGVRMGKNSHLKTMKLEPLLQGALVAIESGVAESYVSAVFTGIYADALDLGNPEVFTEVLENAGLDSKGILAARDTVARASELARRTEEAVERGLFGVPACILDGQLYFGNDRLQFVQTALAV